MSSLEGDNFVPGDPNDPTENWMNGNYVAKTMIDQANLYFSQMDIASPTSANPFLGDTRIRFEVYPSLTEGVFFWENESDIVFENGDDVINIVATDNGIGDGNSPDPTGELKLGRIYLYDWFRETSNAQNNNFFRRYARVTLHEYGHEAGLCHSFSASNKCDGIDLDINEECGGPQPPSSCSGDDGDGCSTWNTGSTNMMSYVPNGVSLTECQWRLYYGFLYNQRPSHIKIDDCLEMETVDKVISEDETWDSSESIDGTITVQNGACLTINCVLALGENSNIIVERGAKLFVNNGWIVNACPEQRWGGIFVEGNAALDQPDPSQGLPANPNQAGIVYLNNALIRGANTAISTSKFGQHWNSNYWGGVVYAFDTEFINNRRSVEFLSYDAPSGFPSIPSGIANESKFIDCNFAAGTELDNSFVGVTIWECYGIEFRGCNFENFGNAALLGVDCGLNVSKFNEFNNNFRGIDLYATYPTQNTPVDIGNNAIVNSNERNLFYENNFGIVINASDEIRGVNIYNNHIVGLEEGISRGINISGGTNFRIFGNIITSHFVGGVYAFKTLDNAGNLINCNYFEDNGFTEHINIRGDNRSTTFAGNTFSNSSSTTNIRIGEFDNQFGQVALFQGNPVTPPLNCFSQAAGIFTTGNVVPFTYFVPFNPIDPCHLTTSNSNFFIQTSNENENNVCENGSPVPIKDDVSSGQYLAKKQQTNSYEQVLTTSPNATEARYNYEKSKMEENFLFRSLVSREMSAGHWEALDNLLSNDDNQKAARWLLGIQLKKGDFVKAAQLINAWPQNNLEDQYFREVMSINLQRLSNDQFVLSEQQENLLYQLSYSDFAIRENARAILVLLNGEQFPIDMVETEGTNLSVPEQNSTLTDVKKYHLFPNPAKGEFTVEYSILQEKMPQFLQINDLNGKLIKQIQLDDSGKRIINTNEFLSGIYFLSIRTSKTIEWQEKLVIIK